MTSHTIRLADEQDVPSVLEMMRKEDILGGTAAHFKATEKDLHRLLFDPREDAEAWVAEGQGGKLVAMMIFSRVLFSGDGKSSLYLSKLWVEEDARGHGLGSRMLDRCVEIARERDYARVFWGANAPNPKAAEFYEKIGAAEEKGVRWFYLPAKMKA